MADRSAMRTSDFDYDLPSELIAQSPVEPRDSSRLLVMHRDTGALEHRHFPDLLEYLLPGDVMVFNQSRVIPARLYGHRADTGSKAEFLLLRRNADGTWQAIARPGRRLRPGVVVDIPGGFWVEIEASHEDGLKTVRLSTEEGIDRFGHTPLPPYIKETLDDSQRYQTVYSRQPGSVAAPTAGLHFTDDLLEKI
ncbi:MAG: S-adenosylmethionine:tRNA ribosyltransferase-isomerase, partial [Chloroflexota bacterium]|nr:S-adenosylmethionine:tRNA ribosyltransferase-isomerase [Chloroflexota bacterium]